MPLGYFIFCQPNYYQTNLFQEMGYDATCTIRGPRKAGAEKVLKTERQLKKEGRGAMDFAQANGVLMVHWMDKKMVAVASTAFSAKPTNKAQIHIWFTLVHKRLNHP